MSSAPPPVSAKEQAPRGVILISYPKVVFLYPSLVVAIVAGIYMQIWGNAILEKTAKEGPVAAAVAVAEPVQNAPAADPGADTPVAVAKPAPAKAISDRPLGPVLAGSIFLMSLIVNLIIISFDFPRTTSVTLAAIVAACMLGIVLLSKYYPNLLPFVSDIVRKLQPEANAMFYFCYVMGMFVIYGFIMVNSKFDYWELRQNELLHHHGFLSDLERYPTSTLKINKEIKDIFEYMLLKSGRMILQAGGNARPIILENVFFIDQKEAQITKLLSSVQVQIAPPSEQV